MPVPMTIRHDARALMPEPQDKARTSRGKTVMRDPAKVTGIVLHQTATPFSVSARMLEHSGGDRAAAMIARIQGRQPARPIPVACHGMAFRDGMVVLTRPLQSYVWHGNGFNATTLGIEIEGRYPGLEDDPKTATKEHMRTTWGGEPQEVTDQVVAAARDLLAWMLEQARAEGMPIRYLYAHRQSSATRRSDPGSELWRRVGLEHGVAVLGLETRPGHTVGSGRPVPAEWDPAGKGAY